MTGSVRLLTRKEVARDILGRSLDWFQRHREAMEQMGFPKPLPVIDKYSPYQVRQWVERGGILDSDDAEHDTDEWLGRLYGKR